MSAAAGQPVDVSIVIPTFNRLWCLPKAVESCRGARCRTQIIVVDDGSSDGTWEWLQKQPDVLAVRQPNQGQTWAINHGLRHATGTYIRFLDSDDCLMPGVIDQQFDAAVASGADLVYARVDLYFPDGDRVVPNPDVPEWDDFMAIQLGEAHASHFLGMLFHRRIVEQVPRRPDFANREDRMFLLEIALLNPKIVRTSGVAGHWVQHGGNMQATYSGLKAAATNWQHLNIYKRILGELDRRGELTLRRKRAAIKILWTLAHWIAQYDWNEALGVVAWIHRLDPDFVPPEPGALGWCYRRLGFASTERLLALRRTLLAPFRRRTRKQER